jgi:branched-chain amino acid transport system substrate-binding protein
MVPTGAKAGQLVRQMGRTKMKLSKRHALFALIAVGMLAFANAAIAQKVNGVTDTEILIGSHGPLTGPAAYIGLGARSGLDLAVEEINAAGGVHGRKLKVLFEDDGFSPAKALAAVKKLVEDNKVFMIFGASGSNPTIGTLDYLRESKVPTYISISSAPAVTRPFSHYIFRGATVETVLYGERFSEFIIEYNKAQRLAIIAGSDELPKNEADATTREMKKNYNLEPVVRVEYKVGDTDFTPQLLKVREANPDLIMINGNLTEAVIIVRQARELGLKQPLFGSGTMVDNSMIAKARAAAEGFMGPWFVPHFIDSNHPDMVKFREAWAKLNPNAPVGRPNVFDYMTYGDMHVVAEGLRRAGRDLTPEKFFAALETLDKWRVSEVAQPRTFTDWHHVGNLNLQMMVIKDGKWVPVSWTPGRESAVLNEFRKK